MGFLRRFAGNPLALLACFVAGGMVGQFIPGFSAYAAVLGQVYLGVVSMAALPLLVVATFFGLRQTLALPQPGWRVLMIVGLAALLVTLCAVAGTFLGALAEPGKNLDYSTRGYLGSLVQQAGAAAGDAQIALMDSVDPVGSEPESYLSALFPDNFFRVLVDGKSLGILLCAIIFGLAFAALSKAQNSSLTAIFEAIYRALEIIISRVNLFIPVLVFSMAAYFVARTDPRAIGAMGSFLGWFLFLATLLSAVAITIVRRQCALPAGEVLLALKAPALISLTSASTTASIPDTIEAMSNKLGFSRGIVELVAPISSVFLRSGSALYYALLTVFVANLYGRALAPYELLLICAGASIAAFASAGNNSAANVGFAGMVLAMLQLPGEAVLALFLAIDVICEGPRNLLTLMFACALIALVSRGLPSERKAGEAASGPVLAPIRFAFTRVDLIVGAAGSVIVAILLVVLGIGVGMRRGGEGAATRPALIGLDTVAFVKTL